MIETSITEAARGLFGGLQDIFFVPIRHHSPACSVALSAMLEHVGPAVVLIEGPEELNTHIELLSHPETLPPVAILSKAYRNRQADPQEVDDSRTAFFPFCDYSPEWVALRQAQARKSQTAFIDMPWRESAWMDPSPEVAKSLMQERYFEHSRYIQAMKNQLGCTDQHELWERLFELRTTDSLSDWQTFFTDVFHWCAMARQDYEPEVLEADMSLPRERHMASKILSWRTKVQGPIVVVTGGFHTPSLIKLCQGKQPKPEAMKDENTSDTWLIRYSFERLDALNGYASGMPSPGYYQRVWEGRSREHARVLEDVSLNLLTEFARSTRKNNDINQASTASVQAAALQAQRLANLRGNCGPGRQDLIDAIQSCYIKGEIDNGTQGFGADLKAFLGGTKIGNIPMSAGSPPLIEDARRLAKAAGVRLDDSTPKTVRLDLYRKQSHRLRSRFLHAMHYLDAKLATWVAGPDFFSQTRMNTLFEEWTVAWSPLVEARLIDLIGDGVTVHDVCLSKIRREENALADQGQSRSASAVVSLLIRACLIGLHSRLPQLINMLDEHLNEDPNLASVVDCGHKLLLLSRSVEPLGMQQHAELSKLLTKTWHGALFLLPTLELGDESTEQQSVKQLISMRELGRLLVTTPNIEIETLPMQQQLLRMSTEPTTPPATCGAVNALLYLDGLITDSHFKAVLSQRFGAGSLPAESVRFLGGVMAAAPELLLRIPELLMSFDTLVQGWDEHAFLTHLPELRRTFTCLKPQETADLAKSVLALHRLGDETNLTQMHYQTNEQEMLFGTRLETKLRETLRRDGLADWLEQEPT
jgi:Family of unknown function (DUF5682)